jgi:hypothetical protein
MSAAEPHKTCTTCGEDKPYSAFTVNSAQKTGRSVYCRECEAGKRRRRDAERLARQGGTIAYREGYAVGFRAGEQSAAAKRVVLPDDFLRDLIRLTHPDRHPPEREALAVEMTGKLNLLREAGG